MKNSTILLAIVLISLVILTFSGNRNVFLGETVDRGYKGLYFLDEFGKIYVSGSAKHLGNLRFRERIARDLELTKNGYLALDKYGSVYSFGDAIRRGDANTKDAIDLELTSNGYYILDRSGKVYVFGDAEDFGSGYGIYVDMELTSDGYYLLKNNGEIDVFGDAVSYGNADGDSIDMELTDNGYYILEKNGKLNFFGDAIDQGYDDGLENVQDIELINKSKGYYILDSKGLAYSYLASAGFPGPEFSEDGSYIDMEILE